MQLGHLPPFADDLALLVSVIILCQKRLGILQPPPSVPEKMKQPDLFLDPFCLFAIANIRFDFCKHTKKKQ